MTIKASFRMGGDVVEAIYGPQGLMFFDISTGIITTLEGLKLSKAGVVKEFPDLENDEDWNKKAIKRLKKHIESFETEEQKINYVIEELRKHGYQPLTKQRAGFRHKIIK